MMNPSVKQAWVEALRSGEYRQAQGRLYDGEVDGYCCLGVLCDVIDPEGWESNGAFEAVIDREEFRMYDVIDPEALDALGMDGDVADALMKMNDELGMSFDEIADGIEASKDL